jgi:hypothetical protein
VPSCMLIHSLVHPLHPTDTSHTCIPFRQAKRTRAGMECQNTNSQVDHDLRFEPTDKHMDNLARLGLKDLTRHAPQWKSTLGKHVRGRAHFDMQPTDPQNNIKGTGNCELWNTQVDLIRTPPVQETTHASEQYGTPSQPPQAEDWLTKVTLPKFRTLPEVTCVYGRDGKCCQIKLLSLQSMRLSTSTDIQHHHPSAPQHFTGCIQLCSSGAHALRNSPVRDLATEIQGFLHRLPRLLKTGNNTKAK